MPIPRTPSIQNVLPLLILLGVLLSCKHPAADAVAADAPFPPIEGLGPSLAASAAAGTVVAVTAPDGEAGEIGGPQCCVVLTCRSAPPGAGGVWPSLAISSPAAASAGNEECAAEPLRPLRAGRLSPSLSILSAPASSSPSFVSAATSPLLLAATGFGPDAHHLSLSAAGIASGHERMYGGATMPAGRAARRLAAWMSRATASAGGRPYGIQAFLVGGSGEGSRAGAPLALYTVDPTGGCRHWSGGGTAIGRDAEQVRRCLVRALRPQPRSMGGAGAGKLEEGETAGKTSGGELGGRGACMSWTDALDRAVLAVIEASTSDHPQHAKTDGVEEDEDPEGIFAKLGSSRAVVVFSHGSAERSTASSCFEVHSRMLEDSYERCVRLLVKEARARKSRREQNSIAS